MTQVNHLGYSTLFNHEMNLTKCQITEHSLTPDVSISDQSDIYQSIASYTAIYDDPNPLNNDKILYVMQVPFADLLVGAHGCPPTNGLEMTGYNANPRISSPSANIIGSNEYECAVTAEHFFKYPITGSLASGIKLYSNIAGSFGIGGVLLNYDPNVTNIIPYSNNIFPAITYASEAKVSVAWTYKPENSNYATDVISVNYELINNFRTPNDYEYYMLVNEIRKDRQYAPSVAGNPYSIDESPVFYTFAGLYFGLYSIVFKTRTAISLLK